MTSIPLSQNDMGRAFEYALAKSLSNLLPAPIVENLRSQKAQVMTTDKYPVSQEVYNKTVKNDPEAAKVLRVESQLFGNSETLKPTVKEKLTVQKESEADFQTWVIDLAHIRGWLVAHFRPARIVKNGVVSYRTAVSADGAGFPDLVLVRDRRLMLVELKSDKGILSEAQDKWLRVLSLTKAEIHIWRPVDREEIERLLL